MRIATWNLQLPAPGDILRNQARLDKIREINADIWVLTETHKLISLKGTHQGASTTPSYRKPKPGEECAAIWSRWPILRRIETSDPSEAVCVEIDHPKGRLLVYGSIIAYKFAKRPDGVSSAWSEHYRFIGWHANDWQRLRRDFPDHILITAGDYNQARDGVGSYGTAIGRKLLTDALTTSSLTCVTEEDLVASGKLVKRHNIDHICLDTSLVSSVTALGAWEGQDSGQIRLSDHNGVWIEIPG